jgi:hypothetical protein
MSSVAPFNTIWPDVKEPPAAVKKWVDDFYHLADNQDADAGERLSQLFTPDATMYGLAGPLTGREGWSGISSGVKTLTPCSHRCESSKGLDHAKGSPT